MRSRNYAYGLQRLLIVAGYNGRLLAIFGVFLLVPALVGVWAREYREGFIFCLTGLVTILLGLAAQRVLPRGRLGVREAVLLCTSAWAICSAIAALPFHLVSHVPVLDSLFECVSGLTTTGLTILPHPELQTRTIIFWRSASQLLGGVGILSFFLLVSYPGTAAHRLLQTEATKASVPRPTPSLRRTVMITWGIYGTLLLFNVLILWILGAGGFNALNYAFTTTSTGGFAPHSAGVAYFQGIGHPNALAIELATIFFMILGGLNYLLHYRALSGNVLVLFSGVEARRYWLLMLVVLALVMIESLQSPAVWQAYGHADASGLLGGTVGFETLRGASFQVASLVSSAGHVTVPLESGIFGPCARLLFLLLLVLGGCAGSTAGGIKILRATVLGRSLLQEMRKLSHPEGSTLPVLLDGAVIESRTVQSMAALAFAWILLGVAGGVFLGLVSGHEPLACLSLSISALSNIGPSFMPMSYVAYLPALGKALLMVWMIAGRLEILPVLALFSHRTWQQ